jgi:hypothetical protein
VAFNWRAFLRFSRLALLNTRNTNRRLTPKRIAWLLLAFTFYPPFELATWAGFALDDILYPGYRRQRVREPVFIVGNPRSGTTFLHRLMARDTATFACMRTWEILFAPSILSRRLFQGMAALDKGLGGGLHRRMAKWEERWQQKNVAHSQALDEPEEDENLFVHTGSSISLWTFAAMLDEARLYGAYDQRVPRAVRNRDMMFYRRCLQRHLYAASVPEAGGRHYLAKNPAFISRIDTLQEHFRDARFVYIARNPLDVIPSFINLTKFVWDLLGDPIEYDSLCRYAIELVRHGYDYPLRRLRHLAPERYALVCFDDLVQDAGKTVSGVYDRLGLDLSSEYARVLERETERARRFRSKHSYSLDELGLNHEQIVKQCAHVFDRFDFDRREKWVRR